MLNKITHNTNMVLFTTLDRITNEEIPYFIDKLTAEGAKNVNIFPGIGKKGRAIYLALIDIPKEKYNQIIETIVYHFYCTGWHILSTKHEYVKIIEKNIPLKYCVNDKAIDINVPFKLLPNDNKNFLILLDHDYCLNLYHKLCENNNIDISFSDLKFTLKNLIIQKNGKKGKPCAKRNSSGNSGSII